MIQIPISRSLAIQYSEDSFGDTAFTQVLRSDLNISVYKISQPIEFADFANGFPSRKSIFMAIKVWSLLDHLLLHSILIGKITAPCNFAF